MLSLASLMQTRLMTTCMASYAAPKTPELDEQTYFCRIRQRSEYWWTSEVLKAPLNNKRHGSDQTALTLDEAKRQARETLLQRLRQDGRDTSNLPPLNWQCS
jgi:hypothetical protein